MKMTITILVCFFSYLSNGQLADTTIDLSSKDTLTISNSYNQAFRQRVGGVSPQTAQTHIHGRNNVVFFSSGLMLSTVESQIFNQEVIERKAMMDRDESTLKNVWERDFSLSDTKTNELMSSQSGLSFYASLTRVVEKCNPVGDLVFTSGFEQVRKLKPNGQLDEEFKRNFFHTWTKKDGVWKLSIKAYTVD
jgi:hypothetical protein